MSVIIPLKEIEVDNFKEFCILFNIKTKKNAGNDGTDEELIIEELEKNKNENWIVNYIYNSSIDGYFKLQLLK
ncbi:MAG: hypothetical protein PHW82_05555 [Bacteroidales bacterium]|nr:hypothetical protein [Bacteroidales bacterium]